MSTTFCDLFKPCDKLSSRLFFNQPYMGPILAKDFDILNLGTLRMQKPLLHPYVLTTFSQKWVPKEACYAPVRSVLGLGPTESLTMDFSYTEQQDVTRIVQKAFESTNRTTHTNYTYEDTEDDSWNWTDFFPLWVSGFGSIFEDIWDGVKDVAGAIGGTAAKFGDAVSDFVGGAADFLFGGGGGGGTVVGGAQGTINQIEEILETVNENQTKYLTKTISEKSNVTERSINRTLHNPYDDRSLELRFIPVFRHFEVVTELIKFHWGIALDTSRLVFPVTSPSVLAGFIQKRVNDPKIKQLAADELKSIEAYTPTQKTGKVSDHLNANSEVYTKRYLLNVLKRQDLETLHQPVYQALQKISKTNKGTKIANALSWSKTSVLDKSILVPGAEIDVASKHLNLTDNAAKKFSAKLKNANNPRVLRLYQKKKDVHIYIGTKIEAVAGQCILKDVPKRVVDT